MHVVNFKLLITNYFDSLINQVETRTLKLIDEHSGDEEYRLRVDTKREAFISEIKRVKTQNLTNLELNDLDAINEIARLTGYSLHKRIFKPFCFLLEVKDSDEFGSLYLIVIEDGYVSDRTIKYYVEMIEFFNCPKPFSKKNTSFF
jgi:hypothetical protein